MTLEQAKNLKYGDMVHFDHVKTSRGKCRDYRVVGRVKTWKLPKNAHRVYVPLKSGLYTYGSVTEHNIDRLHIDGECTHV